MTDVDRIISRSDAFLSADESLSRAEKKQIAQQVLERDQQSCVECGREKDECTLVIRYKEDPHSFDTPSEAMTPENLETVCEQDILGEDTVAAYTDTDESLSDGLASGLVRFEQYLLDNTFREFVSSYWWVLLAGTLGFFLTWSIIDEYLPNVSDVLVTYNAVLLPFVAPLIAGYYLIRWYKPAFEPYESNRLYLLTGVAIGMLGSVGMLLLPGAYTGYVSLPVETIFRGLYLSWIGQFVGAYALNRLVRTDKTEIMLQSQINVSKQYRGSTNLRLNRASRADSIVGEGFDTMRWRTLGFTTTIMSLLALVFFVPTAVSWASGLLIIITTLSPLVVFVSYLFRRTRFKV